MQEIEPTQNEIELDSDESFSAAINDRLAEFQVQISSQDELLVPPDYELNFTEEDFRDMCESEPYDEYYADRINWSPEEIERWKAAGKPRSWLAEKSIITKHPNLLDGINRGWTTADAQPDLTNPLDGSTFETDSEGHPLHPNWETLIKYGIPAGPGFYFHEGNVGNIEGDVAAQDPFIFRVATNEQGEPIFQILAGVRVDDRGKSYAFLGGMRDKSDVDKRGLSGNALKKMSALTAIREAEEEGGVDLRQAPFLHIGNFMVLDKRTTLNTFVSTGMTAFFIEDEADINPNLAEMEKIEWIAVDEELLRPGKMFASHGKLLRMALKVIHDQTGFGVDKNGKIIKKKQNEESSLV